MSIDSKQPEHDGLYPIRAVAQMTGINPITLRAWERRYGLIRPLRTDSGHRLYSQRDVDRIRRILELSEQGVALAQVSRVLESEQGSQPGAAPGPAGTGARAVREQETLGQILDDALEEISEIRLQAFLDEALRWLPPVRVLQQWLLPACRKLGEQRQQDAEAALRHLWLIERTRQLVQGVLSHRAGTEAPVLVATVAPEHDRLPALSLATELLGRGAGCRLLETPTGIDVILQAHHRWRCRAVVLCAEAGLPVSVTGPHHEALSGLGSGLFVLSGAFDGALWPANARVLEPDSTTMLDKVLATH
ncbi:MAG: MerR family transcriptional regulator [Halothiobacillaceae bacterium]